MADEESKMPASSAIKEVRPTSGSLQDSASQGGSDAIPGFDKAAERRLLWKLDLLILPIIFLFYMLSYLDRVNIGSARIQGMDSDLGMNVDNRYNIALLVRTQRGGEAA
jgi:hypothetical protein